MTHILKRTNHPTFRQGKSYTLNPLNATQFRSLTEAKKQARDDEIALELSAAIYAELHR